MLERFDGQRVEEFSREAPLDAFAFVLDLRSDNAVVSKTFDDQSPPMPFVLGDLGFYQNSGYYSLIGDGFDVNFLNPEVRHRIVLVQSRAGLKVYGDGYRFASFPSAAGVQRLALGKGFRQRWWKGDIYGAYLLKFGTGFRFDEEVCHEAEIERLCRDGLELFRLG